MSKNFELLRRAGWGEEYLEGVPAPVQTKRSPVIRQETMERHADPISALVHKLFYRTGSTDIRCIVFLGCAENSGGTSVCARAASALAAQVEDRVCVVDVKFKNPSVHKIFGKDNLTGLRDAVQHSRSGSNFVKQLEESNLWVLPAGAEDGAQRAAVSQRDLSTCLAQLKSEFAYMLIDAPPLNSKSELSALAEVSDGAVLVVDSSGLTADAALRGRSKLRNSKLRLLGMVLNQDQASLLRSLRN
jgi:Mrp family chromosome partitioning ATPase